MINRKLVEIISHTYVERMYYVDPYIILDVFDDLCKLQLTLIYRRLINIFLIMATNPERLNVDTVNYFNKLTPVSAIRVNFSVAIKRTSKSFKHLHKYND